MNFQIFIIALFANFVSLALVVISNGKSLKIIFSNPAFLIGDFIIIPAYFSLLKIEKLIVQPNLLFLSIGFILFWGYKNKLFKSIWIFHGAIAVFVVYIYLFTLVRKDFGTIVILSVLLVFHQFLGILFPKKII